MKKLLLLSLGVLALSITLFGQSENHQRLASADTIYYEPFDYQAGELPSGWVLEGEQAPWSVSNSEMAGGESPELILGYSFASGTIRMISAPINIEGYHELCFKYKQYMINYEADYGEMLGLDVTFDGGQNWQPLWDKMIGLLNIPQDEFAYYFTAPDGSSQMQFAFRFQGNNWAINLWAIDDIVIEAPPENDLLFTPDCFFSGNPTPTAGQETLFFVEALNGGITTQTDYTVKLITTEGDELASTQGESIAFGEKKFFMLSWTPGDEYLGTSTDIYAYIDFALDENPANNQSKHMIVDVMPEGTSSVQITPGSWPLIYLPYNFLNLYSLTQTLYLPDEIGFTNKAITGIQYTCQFDQEVSVPIQIFMGETDKNDLSQGWIDPSQFTPVFDGTINFAKGFNNLFIPLDNAYTYEGGNLVVYSNKSYSEMVIGTPFISAIDTGSMRSRAAQRDDTPYDPMNPPDFSSTWDYYPNITLFYSTGATSVQPDMASPILHVYPNPVQDVLFIEDNAIITMVRVLNMLGQEVYFQNGNSKKISVDVGHFDPGIYLLQVVTTKGTSTQKIQVNR